MNHSHISNSDQLMKTTTKTRTKATRTASKKAPAKSAPAKSAPAKKLSSTAVESPATFISAKANVGFGCHLYLRGTGPGLSWDHGVAMDCVAADLWTASLKNVKEPVVFKILLNDVTWCKGNDYVVEPGQSITVIPSF
jgi:hypothetical protein